MTASATAPGGQRLGWLLPLAGAIIVFALLVGFIVVAQNVGSSDSPPAAGPFTAPDYTSATSSFAVRQRDGETLTLVPDGVAGQPAPPARQVPLGAVSLEGLVPVTLSDVAPGDWVNVIGIPNKVRNFTIRSIVVIPGEAPAPGQFVLNSPGGFFGHETSRDPLEQPVIGGRVLEVTANELFFEGPAGERARIEFQEPLPLFRIAPIRAEQVGNGDRAAARPWADGGAPASMLFAN